MLRAWFPLVRTSRLLWVLVMLAGMLIGSRERAIEAATPQVTTLAGSGSSTWGGDGGPALAAGTIEPFGLEIGPDGALYWAEYLGHCIRRMDLQTKIVTTYAGTGGKAGYRDGPADQAQFNLPHEVRFDADGHLYVSDMKNHTIRKIAAGTRLVSTVAGTGKAGFAGDLGPASQALLSQPHAVVVEGTAGLLICDIANHRIRRVDLKSGLIATVAGTGDRKRVVDGALAATAPLNGPRTLAVDTDGSIIVVLREGNAVYRWDRQTDRLEHLAGTGQPGYSGDGGPAKEAKLAGPKGAAIGPDGDIYLADTESHTVRVLRRKTGTIETVVGDGQKGDGPDGPPRGCRLNRPHGVYFDSHGTLYIGDSSNHKVRILPRS